MKPITIALVAAIHAVSVFSSTPNNTPDATIVSTDGQYTCTVTFLTPRIVRITKTHTGRTFRQHSLSVVLQKQ